MVEWVNIIDWANTNSGFVQLIYASATFMMVVAMLYSNYLSSRLAKIARKPNLYADLLQKHGTILMLAITNGGQLCAYAVKIMSLDATSSEILQEFPCIPPNKNCQVELGSLAAFSTQNKSKLIVRLSFANEWGEEFKVTQTLYTAWAEEITNNESQR